MSFQANFSKFFKTAESDVLSVIVRIKQGIEFADHEVFAGLQWLHNHAGEIAQSVNVVAGVVGSLAGAGVSIPPSVLEAVKDANKAVTALNAMVDKTQAGTPQSLVDGYIAAKQAWHAADSATLAVATAPNPNA